MLHTIGMICLFLGIALVVASVVIFFVTDSKNILKELRTTTTILPQEEKAPEISDMYYDTYASPEKTEPKKHPRFKREDESAAPNVKKEPKETPLEKKDVSTPPYFTNPLIEKKAEPSSRETAPLKETMRQTAPLITELSSEEKVDSSSDHIGSYSTAPLISTDVIKDSLASAGMSEKYETAPLISEGDSAVTPIDRETMPLKENTEEDRWTRPL